jgi:MATE family, multidrug efflux pump
MNRSTVMPHSRGSHLYQRIWSLTWPLLAANALELAVGLVDLWLVRPFGPSATAAIGLCRQVTFLVEAMAVAITAGIIALVSQGVGAQSSAKRSGSSETLAPRSPFDPENVVRQSMYMVFLLALPTTLAGYFLSGSLLTGLQARYDTQAYGEPYLQIYFAGFIITLGSLVSAALFRGAGDVWTPLKLSLGVSLLQVALNYVFVYGVGPWPAFTVQGAAMGMVCARGCGLIAFLFLLLRGRGLIRLRGFPFLSFDWKLMGSVLRIGVPMALANMLRHGSRVVFLAIAGASTLGTSLQATVGVALQVRLIGVLVALAFQTASATLVGQAIGRDDTHEAEVLGRRSVQLLAVLMGIITALLIVLAEPLTKLFLAAPEAAGLGVKVLRWFAIAQFFSSLSIGTQGPLMGAGDTLPAMRYTLVSEWCLLLPLSYLLVTIDWVPDGLLAVWALAPALTLALMQRRFLSRRWLDVATPATRPG